MNPTDRTQQWYLDRLLFWLRMREVPGEQIGDIIAEARAHVATSGESLREAFGPPRRYARQWGRHSRQGWARTAAFSLVALVGATALGRGALALGQGVPAVFGLPVGWVALVGLVLAAGATGLFDYDPVRNPLTGAVPRPGRRGFALLAIALWIGEGVVCFLLGLALVPA